MARTAAEVRLRHRRRRLVPRQGHHRVLARAPAQGARAEGADAEVRPVHQRRPRHDEPVPARRGVRHRGRRRDRPRHRPLRALHRREPLAHGEPHGRVDLGSRDPQGAQGRVPRLHRAGDPAHHERDQGADPERDRGERLRRGRDRDRRDGRRHRVAAVPRGDPPVPPRGGPGERLLRPRDARPVHRHRRRAEDEADPALGQRAAPHRHPPGRDRGALPRFDLVGRSGTRSRSSQTSSPRRSSRTATSPTSTSSRPRSSRRASTPSSARSSACPRARWTSASGST